MKLRKLEKKQQKTKNKKGKRHSYCNSIMDHTLIHSIKIRSLQLLVVHYIFHVLSSNIHVQYS